MRRPIAYMIVLDADDLADAARARMVYALEAVAFVPGVPGVHTYALCVDPADVHRLENPEEFAALRSTVAVGAEALVQARHLGAVR